MLTTPSLHAHIPEAALHLPASLQTLVASIRQFGHPITPDVAKHLVISANVSARDLAPWSDFQHPTSHSYGRKPIYVEPNFEILVMSWAAGDYSAIHDHGVAQWGAVQCFGLAEHNVYTLEGKTLRLVEQGLSRPNSVNAVDSSLIHQMGNPTHLEFLSLHVYGSTAGQSSVTGDARIFDLFEGSIQHTDGGVFFCMPEADISHRTYGLKGGRNATLLHHQWMLARVHKMLVSGDCNVRSMLNLKRQLLERIEDLQFQHPTAPC